MEGEGGRGIIRLHSWMASKEKAIVHLTMQNVLPHCHATLLFWYHIIRTLAAGNSPSIIKVLLGSKTHPILAQRCTPACLL